MNYILTISYHNEKVAKTAYEQLCKTVSGKPTKVILLDNNYPLIKDKNYIKDLCALYDFEYVNVGQNLGLHHGYNHLISLLPKEVESFICYDGDSYPVTPGWDEALLKVHQDPNIIWSSLHNEHSYKEINERGYTPVNLFGIQGRLTHRPVINSICAFRKSWIESVGGLTEPSKYYGGLEVAMFQRIPHGKYWIFLDDYSETRINNADLISDPLYTQYKWEHAHLGNPLSFEEWLKKE